MGLRRILAQGLRAWNTARFALRKALVGFENANSTLRLMDKRAVADVLRRNGALVGADVDIETPLLIHNADGSYRNLSIGSQCHIGKNVLLDLRDRIDIGDRVTVSMGTVIATHIDVGRSELAAVYPSTSASVTIEDDCYIGASATILHGVTVGKGSVIGAGSVVNRSVTGSSVVGGVPARVIKQLNWP